MSRLLTLSRAARLVGVSRGALQTKIKSGELPTFEGMVDAADLVRAYPNTKLDDSAALERFKQIKDNAFAQRLRERLLPNADVLAARLSILTKEHAQNKVELERYQAIVAALEDRLAAAARGAGKEAQSALKALTDWLRGELAAMVEGAEEPGEIILKDSFLRIMSAHVRILPSEHEFFVEGSDSILDAALRAGLALDYGCSSGACGLCKGKVLSGEITKIRPHDYVLTEAEKGQGYALLCCNTAVTDLVVEAGEAQSAKDIGWQKIAARVKRAEALSDDTMLLHLQTPRTNRLRFLAGQSVKLAIDEQAAAEHPVASCPCDDRNLHFHVRREPGNAFAERVFSRIKPTDVVQVEGPQGEFVLNDDSPRSLIFVACDTGFAPIKSLIEHAMSLDAAESLHLYWIACAQRAHYLNNLCRSWTDALDNFEYTPLTAPAGNGDFGEYFRAVLPRVATDHANLSDFDVYVAGPQALAEVAESTLCARGLPHAQLRATVVK